MNRVKKKELSVIIPVYNEKETLTELVNKVLKQKDIFEIIIVDDGSTDGSAVSIKSLVSENVKLVAHSKNQGKGAAMITGLKYAKGRWVIFQDADLECDPNDYPKLLKPLIENQADFVVGNRWKNYHGYLFNKYGNWLVTTFVNFLYGTKVTDACCGYKVGPREIWNRLKLDSQKFEIDVEIIAKLVINKVKFTEVDVDYHPRTYVEGKKVRAIDAIKDIIKLLSIRLHYLP